MCGNADWQNCKRRQRIGCKKAHHHPSSFGNPGSLYQQSPISAKLVLSNSPIMQWREDSCWYNSTEPGGNQIRGHQNTNIPLSKLKSEHFIKLILTKMKKKESFIPMVTLTIDHLKKYSFTTCRTECRTECSRTNLKIHFVGVHKATSTFIYLL